MTERSGLVIVGASLAGLRAVEAARSGGYEGPITLVGAEEHLPYDRPPLSKAFLESADAPDVTFRARDVLEDELGVTLRLGAAATGLDPVERVVAVGETEIPYDALVVATGASARELPGTSHLPGVVAIRTLEDAQRVRRSFESGARTVVIGAGIIGSEVASGAHKRGLRVSVLEGADVPLTRAVGAPMGEVLAGMHARNEVALRCGVRVSGIERTDTGLAVQVDGADPILADLVVVGVGASPVTGWLEGSGLKVDDGVVCDRNLWTGVPGVFAAGDVARFHNPMFGREMRLENWTSAAEQGGIAARNALGLASAAEHSTVPYFWTDWYGVRIQFVGIPDADEVQVVTGDPDDTKFVALYRTGDRLSGALCVGYPSHTMKYRAMIARAQSWSDGLAFAASKG